LSLRQSRIRFIDDGIPKYADTLDLHFNGVTGAQPFWRRMGMSHSCRRSHGNNIAWRQRDAAADVGCVSPTPKSMFAVLSD
jgi:hypothetical protein